MKLFGAPLFCLPNVFFRGKGLPAVKRSSKGDVKR